MASPSISSRRHWWEEGGAMSRISSSLEEFGMAKDTIGIVNAYAMTVRLFCVGGRKGTEPSDNCQYIDIDTSNWKSLNEGQKKNGSEKEKENESESGIKLSSDWHLLPPLQMPRSNSTIIHYNNRLFAIGGVTSEGVSSSCEYLDLRSIDDGWRFLSDMINARAGAAATIYFDRKYGFAPKLIVIGGRSQRSGMLSTCEIYDFFNEEWHSHLIPSLPLPPLSCDLLVDQLNGRLIVIVCNDKETNVELFDMRSLENTNRRLSRMNSSSSTSYSSTPPSQSSLPSASSNPSSPAIGPVQPSNNAWISVPNDQINFLRLDNTPACINKLIIRLPRPDDPETIDQFDSCYHNLSLCDARGHSIAFDRSSYSSFIKLNVPSGIVHTTNQQAVMDDGNYYQSFINADGKPEYSESRLPATNCLLYRAVTVAYVDPAFPNNNNIYNNSNNNNNGGQ